MQRHTTAYWRSRCRATCATLPWNSASKVVSSSAVGAGQFLKGTFVGLYKQINPNTALNDDQIASLRNDSKVALQVLEVFTRQNAQLLQRAGKGVNGANLYLLHFLGARTGMAALNAAPNTPIDQVIHKSDPRNAAQILSQNAGYLRTDKGKGPARTVAQLQTFLGTNQILNTSLVFGAIVIFFVILVPRGILPTLRDAASALVSAVRVVKGRFRAEHLIERRT